MAPVHRQDETIRANPISGQNIRAVVLHLYPPVSGGAHRGLRWRISLREQSRRTHLDPLSPALLEVLAEGTLRVGAPTDISGADDDDLRDGRLPADPLLRPSSATRMEDALDGAFDPAEVRSHDIISWSEAAPETVLRSVGREGTRQSGTFGCTGRAIP